ncbi:helix-turn-helix domain-containing protein [Gilvimarinus sp. DZF01]|uniref:helix-turn-helix domain-containing protein n=1 Tax=Gilvimarinus sp. DZF01 TaxID=3461371 RepID=UPI004045A1CD
MRQQDLGARLGVPQSFVSKYERGERKLTFVEVLLVCDACQYDPGELVRQILPYVQR